LESSLEELRSLSEKYGVPGLDLTQVAIPLEHLSVFPREVALRQGALPVLMQDERIFLAMQNPSDKKVIDELEFVTGKKVFPYVAPASVLTRVIEDAYEAKAQGKSYYLGQNVPDEVLARLGITTEKRPAPEAPALRRSPSDARMPASIMPPKMDQPPAAAPDLLEGDFAGGSELSQVAPLPMPMAMPAGIPGAPSTAPNPASVTVLIVDDEEDIRRLLKRVLLDRGYRVLEADRGTTALRIVKDSTPDLIVLDAMLPEIHGFDICKRIKGSQKYGHIPVIMISAVYKGWRYAEDIRQNYGVEAYLEKPFRITEVVKAIENALTKPPSTDVDSRDKSSAEAEKCLHAGIAAYQAGDIDTAITHLRRGSNIDPLAYRVHYHLGLLYGKKGLLYEAIQVMETAVEINGRHFPALKNLAVLYQKAGFRLKAIEIWERALSMAPDDPTRQGIREHLLSLL